MSTITQISTVIPADTPVPLSSLIAVGNNDGAAAIELTISDPGSGSGVVIGGVTYNGNYDFIVATSPGISFTDAGNFSDATVEITAPTATSVGLVMQTYDIIPFGLGYTTLPGAGLVLTVSDGTPSAPPTKTLSGTGSATLTTGNGNVVVTLTAKDNTVNGGNGNDTVNILSGGNDSIKLGTGTDNIAEAAGTKGDSFILTGSSASLLIKGANDVAFIRGGTDSIADQGKGLEVEISATGGVVNLTGFGADKTGLIDLVGGIGGFKSAKAVISALQSDGNGGTLLSFGAAGHIDFAGVAVGTLKAASFHIG